MNKKTVLCLLVLCVLITGLSYAWSKYEKYIPTDSVLNFSSRPSDKLHIRHFTAAEIQQIRTSTPITLVKVYKSDRLVRLIHRNQIIQTYPMRLGFNPVGHKVQEGDGKTPEGRYLLDWRNPNSAFYKSLHVSYPNAQDKKTAQALGVSPGGDIMIHGSATTAQVKKLPGLMNYMPKNDWTWGCIAVSNIDMDEIWQLVDDGTPIEIYQ
jgi:murein L,D-transpeptidase YafK